MYGKEFKPLHLFASKYLKQRIHVNSSNDLSYNIRFAYDGLPNSQFAYCHFALHLFAKLFIASLI